MATGSIILTPGAAVLPDGTTSNLAPALQRVKSSATAPGIYAFQLAFDAAADEWVTWQFRIPDDYASGPTLKIQWKATSATSGVVVWDARVSATSPGDSQDVDAQDFDSANTANGTAPSTAGYLVETSITLTNADSLAAGDFVVIRLCRVGSSGSDTATGDAEMMVASLTYTTV